MRARASNRYVVTPRRRRWSGVGGGRADYDSERPALTALLAVAVFVLASIGGFTWAMDRQLRGGLLAQHHEAVLRPDWVAIQDLPAHLPLAFLVAVDPTFLQRSPLNTGAEGTTLARQLARQVHRLGDTLGGQARQLVMGPLLETRLSEPELIELYLNRIFLGTNDGWPVHGIYHAAQEYFGKEPQRLTLGESATLAGLLLPPRIVEPNRQVGSVGIRRNEVLRQMLETEVISVEEYSAALQEPLGFQPGPAYAPVTRPAGWDREPEVIQLPPELDPDVAAAQATAGS
jgi:membrane peptidoglycan carboxypeptidase